MTSVTVVYQHRAHYKPLNNSKPIKKGHLLVPYVLKKCASLEKQLLANMLQRCVVTPILPVETTLHMDPLGMTNSDFAMHDTKGDGNHFLPGSPTLRQIAMLLLCGTCRPMPRRTAPTAEVCCRAVAQQSLSQTKIW